MSTRRIVEYDCFFCDSCRKYVYDESVGDPARGIPARTRVDMLSSDWRCPICGAAQEQLRASTMIDDFMYEDADNFAGVFSRTVKNVRK